MPNPSAYRIMLLPQNDYWGWVGAAKDYALRFQTTLTPTPQNAARFHFPKQIITVVVSTGAYPAYGDIAAWLRSEAPGVELDILNVPSPDALSVVLNERIARGDATWMPPQQLKPVPAALVDQVVEAHEAISNELPVSVESTEPPPLPIELLWPTDYADILQGFGDNPDMYQRFGYPGHEGVDIKAPLNSNIYACAAGQVYRVDDGTTGHPYGIHIRMRHANGYSTIYAHLNQALVHAGQEVGAGEQIGLANSTGNATASHLHLTLTLAGATDAGLTTFPNDIIDPTPYLIGGPQQAQMGLGSLDWPFEQCLVGLNVRGDGGNLSIDWDQLASAGFEAVRLMGSHLNEALGDDNIPAVFMVAQLRADLSRQVVAPAGFVAHIRHDLQSLYERGVRYFELHNEPNLSIEGFGTTWGSGAEFGSWFLAVVALLRPDFPEARFGWPGLSPGSTEGMRFDYRIFLEGAHAAISQADWIGCHCYWQSQESIYAYDGGLSYRHFRDLWPNKLVLITDFANVLPYEDAEVKLQQYQEYFSFLRSEIGVGAAFLSLPQAPSQIGYVQLSAAGSVSPQG